jgi:hypothetical protein
VIVKAVGEEFVEAGEADREAAVKVVGEAGEADREAAVDRDTVRQARNIVRTLTP